MKKNYFLTITITISIFFNFVLAEHPKVNNAENTMKNNESLVSKCNRLNTKNSYLKIFMGELKLQRDATEARFEKEIKEAASNFKNPGVDPEGTKNIRQWIKGLKVQRDVAIADLGNKLSILGGDNVNKKFELVISSKINELKLQRDATEARFEKEIKEAASNFKNPGVDPEGTKNIRQWIKGLKVQRDVAIADLGNKLSILGGDNVNKKFELVISSKINELKLQRDATEARFEKEIKEAASNFKNPGVDPEGTKNIRQWIKGLEAQRDEELANFSTLIYSLNCN